MKIETLNNNGNPPDVKANVSGSGFIQNPVTIEDFANNAKFQLSNVNGWMGVNDYECALIKARCLVDDLENLMALKLGLPS